MTTKPPEDEAELLAKEYARNGSVKSNHPHDAASFLDGYRAGQAPLLKEIERLKQFEPPRFWKFHDTHEYRDELEKDFKELSDQLTASEARAAALVVWLMSIKSQICRPVSMTDACQMLGGIERQCDKALSAHAEKSEKEVKNDDYPKLKESWRF